MTSIALHPFFSVMSFFFFFFVFSVRNVLLEKKLIFVRKYKPYYLWKIAQEKGTCEQAHQYFRKKGKQSLKKGKNKNRGLAKKHAFE